MKNTLLDGESLIVSNMFYEPQRGDIIVFHQTGNVNEPVVKRVIATEGETVSISYLASGMQVRVTDVSGNSTVLEEDYVRYVGYQLYYAPTTVTVPEGCLFVMGDNRNESMDSRHPNIGLVDERRVLGHVLFRVTPLSRIGAVQ
jgi:signal peptidase I